MLIQLGIRRSGTHAISQWLFPMLKDFVFLNMDSQIGILDHAALVKNGSFNVLMSFENIPLEIFNQYAENKNSFLVVRHPLNMLASAWNVYRDDTEDRLRRINEAIKLYKEYKEFTGVIIVYDSWVKNKEYRKFIAKRFDLRFDDSNFKKVWGYGGSSFDDKEYLKRYEQITDEEFRELLNETELLKQFEYYKRRSEKEIIGI